MTTSTRSGSAEAGGIEDPLPPLEEEKSEEIANPYVGPRAFENQGTDRELFFGRNRETRELLNLLIAERIVLFYSPSGAGKTSLINAALRPLLEEENFYVFPVLRVSTAARPSGENIPADLDPYTYNLLVSLEGALVEDLRGHGREAELAKISLAAFLERRKEIGSQDGSATGKGILAGYLDYLSQWRKGAGDLRPMVFIFDQFEEVLIIDSHDPHKKEAFFDQIGAALRDNSRWALFSMREDYIGQIEPYMRRIPTQLRTTYRLDLLNEKAAREAIPRPAEKAKGKFEDEATTYLITDLRMVAVPVADTPGVDRKFEKRPGPYIEPVQLQVVCRQLWEDKKKKNSDLKGRRNDAGTEGIRIELADVQGRNVDDALASYYADQIAAVAKHTRVRERKIRDWIEHRLIIEGAGGDARGQVQEGTKAWHELGEKTIHALRETHLVRAEHRRGFSWLELAHDRLIKPVRKNNDEWRKSRLRHKLLRFAPVVVPVALLLFLVAVSYFYLERNNTLSNELDEAQGTATSVANELTDAQQTATSVAQRQPAIDLSRQLALQSTVFTDQPDLALLLSVEAFRNADTGEARQSMLRELLVPSSYVLDEGAHPVYSVAFNSTGNLLVSGTKDGTVILWVMATGDQFPLAGSNEAATNASLVSVVFSPDGGTVASASEDGTLRLWDVTGLPMVLGYDITSPDSIISLAFNPKDNILAWSGCVQGAGCTPNRISLLPVPVLDLTTNPTQTVSSLAINMIAFSPDGKTLASANEDGSISLWDVSSGAFIDLPPIPANPEIGEILSLAFSPDGKTLALGASQGDVALLSRPLAGWGTPSDTSAGLLDGSSQVLSLAFSPDSQMLAWGTVFGNINISDLTDLTPPAPRVQPLRRHEGSVYSLAFHRDGKTLASGGEDGTIKVWDVARRKPIDKMLAEIRGGSASSIAFAPQDEVLASFDGGQSIALWRNIESQQPISQTLPTNGDVNSLALSPDGRTLAVGSTDNKLVLWNMNSRLRVSQTLLDRRTSMTSLAFSHDSRVLFIGSKEGIVSKWNIDIDTHQSATLPFTSSASIDSLAISKDGNTLALGGADGAVIIESIASLDTHDPLTLTVHTSSVSSLAFSPDNNMLASGSEAGVITLSFLDSASPLSQTLATLGRPVNSLAFSPDSKQLVSVTTDGPVITWDVDPFSWQGNVCSIATRNLTSAERRVWLQIETGEPYHPTCSNLP